VILSLDGWFLLFPSDKLTIRCWQGNRTWGDYSQHGSTAGIWPLNAHWDWANGNCQCLSHRPNTLMQLLIRTEVPPHKLEISVLTGEGILLRHCHSFDSCHKHFLSPLTQTGQSWLGWDDVSPLLPISSLIFSRIWVPPYTYLSSISLLLSYLTLNTPPHSPFF